jgi:hypothetical protein
MVNRVASAEHSMMTVAPGAKPRNRAINFKNMYRADVNNQRMNKVCTIKLEICVLEMFGLRRPVTVAYGKALSMLYCLGARSAHFHIMHTKPYIAKSKHDKRRERVFRIRTDPHYEVH